jgi:hypothetical protein
LDLRARVTARSRRAAPLDDDQLLLHAEHDPDVLAGRAAQDDADRPVQAELAD